MSRNIRVIKGPLPSVTKMIIQRLHKEDQDILEGKYYNAIALINSTIPNIYYYADLAQKAGQVHAAILYGTCPQHITTLALFGEMAAVNTAVRSIEIEEEKSYKK